MKSQTFFLIALILFNVINLIAWVASFGGEHSDKYGNRFAVYWVGLVLYIAIIDKKETE
jgi:hypothetical protein